MMMPHLYIYIYMLTVEKDVYISDERAIVLWTKSLSRMEACCLLLYLRVRTVS